MGKSTINGPFSIAMLVYQRLPEGILGLTRRPNNHRMDLSPVARQLRRQATLREAQDSVEGPQMRNSFLQDLPLEP